MKPEHSIDFLKRRLGKPPEQLTARAAFKTMCDFYADERADGANIDEDGDMLLYQWGVYSFGQPEAFRIGITRQFMLPDEDEPYQLVLTFYFSPTEALRQIGSSNQWCSSPSELEQFRQYIENSDAFKAVADAKPDRTDLRFAQM